MLLLTGAIHADLSFCLVLRLNLRESPLPWILCAWQHQMIVVDSCIAFLHGHHGQFPLDQLLHVAEHLVLELIQFLRVSPRLPGHFLALALLFKSLLILL